MPEYIKATYQYESWKVVVKRSFYEDDIYEESKQKRVYVGIATNTKRTKCLWKQFINNILNREHYERWK